MSYGNKIPNLGRFGSFGLGRQSVPGTKVVPTHFLRMNGGSSMTPTILKARDNYANASLFTMAERVQGRNFQGKSVNFEVEHTGLALLLQLILGKDIASGVITPNQLNFDNNMPLPPVTIEANIPGSPTRAVDVQFNNLQLSMNQRANFTGQAGFMGVIAEDMTDPAPAVLPVANVYQMKDHFIKYAGGEVQPEGSSLTLDVPIAPIDAARGNNPDAANFIVGFERNGPIQLGGQFSLPGVPKTLLTAFREGTFASLEWVLRKYGPGAQPTDPKVVVKEIKFVIPNAELNMVEPPMTLDRIVTPITWSAVSLAGEVPFTVAIQ